MQKVTIIGNVGNDAVVRKNNNSGEEFTSFSVAVNEGYTTKEGEKVERTQWYEVVYNKTGISKFLTSGTKVYVEGRPNYGIYLNKEGKSVIAVTVNARQIEFLSAKNDK